MFCNHILMNGQKGIRSENPTFSHYERFDMQLYFSPFFFCYVPTVGAKCPLWRLKAMATLTEMYTITVTQITHTNTEELSCGKHWAQSMLTVALCCIVFASFLLVFCCTLWPVSGLNCSEVLYCVGVPPSPTPSSTRSSNKTISHSHTRDLSLLYGCALSEVSLNCKVWFYWKRRASRMRTNSLVWK